MYDDWKAGRPTEIDFLNGYVAKLGRQFGIPTPLNDLLTAVIKTITERDRTGPGIVRIDGAVVQPVSLDRAAIASLPAEHQLDISTVMPGMQGQRDSREGSARYSGAGDRGGSCDGTFGRRKIFSLSHACNRRESTGFSSMNSMEHRCRMRKVVRSD